MIEKYNYQPKTMGPRAAQLFTELNELRRSTFTLADVESITGLAPAAARSLAHKAQTRGLCTRLKPGLYSVVPFDLGRATTYVDNPYLIAKELVGRSPYFISHGAAMELHRMVTQPMFSIHVSCEKRMRSQTVGGYDFRFAHISPEQNFGTMKHWVNKERHVMVSDMERTIIDCLRHPGMAGGITEVAKGLWMKRDDMKIDRLINYALRLDVGAVIRRLGYLLEYYKIAEGSILDPLRSRLTATYQRLDPILPAEGHFVASWRLQLNVPPEELDAVRFT